MGSFLGISAQVWQTLIVLALPVLYRSLPRIRAIWLRLRYGPPVNQNQPSVDRVSTSDSLKRLGLARWILLAGLYITIILRCTAFNPAKENPFAITRLPLNTPSVSLTAALVKHHRAHGLNDTPITQQRLLQRLTSLDSRLLYTILGPDSLLNCRWCRPPSKEANHTNDHFYYHLPRLASQYALAFMAMGLLTTNASSLESKRRIWRSRSSVTLIFGLILEMITVFVLLHVPSLGMNAKNEGRMLGDKIYMIRHILFGCVFGICSWSVMTETQESNATALAKVGIQIGSVTHQLDTLVSRLRVAALQRSTVMRDPVYRNQSNEFWEYAENQAKIASKDKGVKLIKKELGLHNTSVQPDSNREELKRFIEISYPIPTLSVSDPVL
ncbi:uncharacterized protein MELLADRAFT_72773 [Melampsora larici-populina 98AG31]|uniref:Uncharacterized protein n=1 Tax=Melampsora larici-populina (strain 98AG31 / pathotype 3-4-7) TaxID=747676 RepID=F4RYP6_MELLP|nr:uncharacterized protein MELLADRAFT_72773 [Melampsora larici-populina 98AG31]EGG02541.1 hypothetical protein MELLADRAFT_72773 [Melampsora larici-populina 98AG31]